MLKYKGRSTIVTLVLIVVLGYCWYSMKKSANYAFQYEGKVEGTICDAVKPDHRHILSIDCD